MKNLAFGFWHVQFLRMTVFLSFKIGQFLLIEIYFWLTLVGLHAEVAAGGGRGRGRAGSRGRRAITRASALDHAALRGGRSMAVASYRGTIVAGRRNSRLLHGGMAGP